MRIDLGECVDASIDRASLSGSRAAGRSYRRGADQPVRVTLLRPEFREICKLRLSGPLSSCLRPSVGDMFPRRGRWDRR